MNGYIKLHRSLFDWEWWDDLPARTLFITILLMANWKDKKWHGKRIKRGQLWTSISSLAMQSGLTYRQTRTALEKLKSTGEVTDRATNEGRLITVVNYDIYQSDDAEATSKTASDKAGKRQTSDKQRGKRATTTEEREEIKKGRRGNDVPSQAEGLLYFGDID